MSIRIFLAERYIPAFIRKKELKNLFQRTALAFGQTAPDLNNTSFDDCLAEFARFTKTCVDEMGNQEKEIAAVQIRLFQSAFDYGKMWRMRLGVTTMKEVMRAGRVLYGAIGIDFRGTDQGLIEIKGCYFSRYYSPDTCNVISAFDAGIMAGLSNGRILSFSQRMTEGCSSCKAQMNMKEQVA